MYLYLYIYIFTLTHLQASTVHSFSMSHKSGSVADGSQASSGTEHTMITGTVPLSSKEGITFKVVRSFT